MSLGLVALVGAPNVGKSTIFNRFVGTRSSIVQDNPGVTRDRIYGTATWLTKSFRVVDTGGIEMKNAAFQGQIRTQAQMAIDEADLIVFVVDGRIGVSDDDKAVAKMLYRSNKPVILAVNKIDNVENIGEASEFYSLGLGDPVVISGSHGIGIGDILDKIVATLPEKEEPDYGDAITFCLIGRPNVGKSSLTNALLGSERVIVDSTAGTTRDAIDTPFTADGKHYVVIDTAGLLKKGRIYEAIDKYAAVRALAAIDRSQVAVLLLDASVGIIEQDTHVSGYAVEAKKSMVVVVNKWDLHPKGLSQADFVKKFQEKFKFLDFVKVIFISAKNKTGIEQIYPAVAEAFESGQRRIPTSILNKIVLDAQAMNPTPNFNHGRLKVYFASQVSINPPTFVLFCNNPEFAHFSYTRYFENRFRASFDFTGSPINIVYRERK